MVEDIKLIVDEYLNVFEDEKERQTHLLKFLNENNFEEATDWNNFEGHIVASGFIYSKADHKFLVLYHNDFKIYVYPGGHIESGESILEAAKREIIEETGLRNFKQIKITDNESVPIDIDTHLIGYNEKLNLPEHYHFDFRYLFIVDSIEDVKIDEHELSDYKWIDANELKNQSFGKAIDKIIKLLNI